MSDLLSQGGYGCVYHPSISCSGNAEKSKSHVSKLQRNDWAATNEIEIGKLIKKIKNYQLYFLPITSSCDIKLSNVDQNLLSDCKVVQKRPDADFVLMKMDYLENISFTDYLSANSKSQDFMLSKLVQSYLSITRNIGILNDNDIVHHDLKIDNILIGAQTLAPVIIDFGISLNMKSLTSDDKVKLDNYFYVDAPDYYPWSIEIHIVNYIVQSRFEEDYGKLTSGELREIAKGWVDGNVALDIMSKKFKHDFLQKTYDYIDKFNGMTNKEALDTILPTYKKWDIYAISIIFFKIISFLYDNGFPNTNFLSEFTQMCLINISPNPSDRLTCDESIKYLYDITSREDSINDLNETILSISANDKKKVTSTPTEKRIIKDR